MMTFLSLGRMGRMANAMFEIAGTIGISEKCGQSYWFPLWINHDAAERFGSTEDIDLYKYFMNPLPEVPSGISFSDYPYYWGYREIWRDQSFHSGNWNLNSHFQSPKYFNHCIDKIRHYFTMYDEKDYDFTAIHMRWGDYDGNYHPLPKLSYYDQALNQIPGPYMLFSDDIDKSLMLLKPLGIQVEVVEEGYIKSFKIMKRCKHFICGNSSYSLMAAILADHPDKMVSAPSLWFGTHVGLETVDLYPENCLII